MDASDEPDAKGGLDVEEDRLSNEHDTSPASYFWWLQTLRKSISAGRMERLAELKRALVEKRKKVLLTTNESLLQCALAIFALSANSDPPHSILSDATALASVVELHHEQTKDAASSSQNARLYMAYASFVVRLYCAYHSIELGEEDFESADESAGKIDLIHQWTGLSGGPILQRDGRYDSLGHLRIPTRHQVLAAKLEGSWDQLLSVQVVREILRDLNARIAAHLQASQAVWSLFVRFEVAHMPENPTGQDLDRIKSIYLARIATPHLQYDRTAQLYSTFVSRWMPSGVYEETMAHAYTMLGRAKSIVALCEPYEEGVRSSQSKDARRISIKWQVWKPYLTWASQSFARSNPRQRGFNSSLDAALVISLFERVLIDCGLPSPCAEAELSHDGPPLTNIELAAVRGVGDREMKKQQAQLDNEAMKAERATSAEAWATYLTFLSASKLSATVVLDVCSRAAKALPSNGALQGQILRTHGRLRRSAAQIDEFFSSCLANADLRKNVNAMVDLLLARIDVERDQLANKMLLEGKAASMQEALILLPSDEETFMNVFGTMAFAHDTLAAEKLIDPLCRLELIISDWCIAGGATTSPLAQGFWESATETQPDNSDVWLHGSKHFISRCEPNKAKEFLLQGLRRHGIASEKKTQLAEELVRLYRVTGSVQDVDWAIARAREERDKCWNEYYSTYASTTHESFATEDLKSSMASDVDMPDQSDGTGKRKLVGEMESELNGVRSPSGEASSNKLGKQGDVKVLRDRENCSVMVDNLPFDATEHDLLALFKDCGDILEIVGPRCVGEQGGIVANPGEGQPATALVEFVLRDSIPAARSRHRKPIRSKQVDVRLGYECTLFVTNFPSLYDSDAEMRKLFQQFGRIFDIRWPSKKYAASRRFCYIVFCTAEDAQRALAQHDAELTNEDVGEESGRTVKLQVHLSDPHRKKLRSDAFNDDKELFINGLPRNISETDLIELFAPGVQHVRIPKHPDGRNRGIAYVDMATVLDAQRALGKAAEVEGGGYRVNGKLLTVNLVDRKKQASQHGQGKTSEGLEGRLDVERRNRCLFVRGIPRDAQEPIIQQVLERTFGAGTVARIEWTAESATRGQATVEFRDTATAGRIALASATVFYNDGHPLHFAPLESRGAAASLGDVAGSMLVPRQSPFAAAAPRRGSQGRGRGRGRGGIGFRREQAQQGVPDLSGGSSQMDVDREGVEGESIGKSKDQNTFRQMLFRGGASS